MAKYDYDLFVIGAGSGGVRAARLAAMSRRSGRGGRGGSRVGGTCVIRGCVPKKLMVYASGFAREFELAKGYGWSGCEGPSFSWKDLPGSRPRTVEIARLVGHLHRQPEEGWGGPPSTPRRRFKSTPTRIQIACRDGREDGHRRDGS